MPLDPPKAPFRPPPVEPAVDFVAPVTEVNGKPNFGNIPQERCGCYQEKEALSFL